MPVVHKTFKNADPPTHQAEELVDLENSAEAIDATAGTLRMIKYDNTLNSATTYLRLYILAAGSVTVNSTAPDHMLPCPAATKDSIEIAGGFAYDPALSAAATTSNDITSAVAPSSTFSVDFVIST